MRAAVLAAIVVLCPRLTLAEEAVFGPLTLTYDPVSWQVDGPVIRCLADDCGAFVVDVVDDGGESCSRNAMYGAAAAAFPAMTRHAVNPHVIGNLVLFLALSGDEPGLHGPQAVRACVAHDGASIHVTSQLDAGGLPERHDAGLVLALLRQGLRTAPGEARQLRVDDIVIHYRSDAWEVRPRSEDGWNLVCLPPACPPEVHVHVRVLADGAGDCLALDDEMAWEVQQTRVEAGDGLTFTLHRVDLMCRNLVPPLQIACATHGDRVYAFESSLPGYGCISGAGVPTDALIGLLEDVGLDR